MISSYRIQAIKDIVNTGRPQAGSTVSARQAFEAQLAASPSARLHGAPSHLILARAAKVDTALQRLPRAQPRGSAAQPLPSFLFQAA